MYKLENTENEAKEYTEQMMSFIEKWLGNPAARRLIKFATKKCPTCGIRLDLVAKTYSGEKPKMCFSCKTAVFVIRLVFDSIIKKVKIDQADVELTLKEPLWRKGLTSVLQGIAKYGTKKPFTSYAPFLIVWNITRACNLRCKHCYESALVPEKDELSTKEALKCVDDMAEAGVAYIAISGGEPLVRKDLFEIIKRLNEREISFSIATNATLLTKKNAKKLKENKCSYVQISLDGSTPETHNSFRGKNAFEKTIQGIKNVVEADLIVGTAMTVTNHNLHEVPAVVDLSENLGVQFFMHYNFIPTGRGTEIADLDISPEQREELLNWISNQAGNRKISLLSTAPQYSRVALAKGKGCSLTHFDVMGQNPELGDSVRFLAEFVGGCGTGRLYMALEPNGDMEPCVFIPIILGNIKTDSLLDIWHNHPSLLALRKREEFKGHCQVCQNRNICGGCRARAYGYYRDLQGPDPGCINNLKYWKEIKGTTHSIIAKSR